MTCDGLKTVPQTSGCDRKRSVTDSGQTSRAYVERPETLMRQNIVVVWIQCLLARKFDSMPCTAGLVLGWVTV